MSEHKHAARFTPTAQDNETPVTAITEVSAPQPTGLAAESDGTPHHSTSPPDVNEGSLTAPQPNIKSGADPDSPSSGTACADHRNPQHSGEPVDTTSESPPPNVGARASLLTGEASEEHRTQGLTSVQSPIGEHLDGEMTELAAPLTAEEKQLRDRYLPMILKGATDTILAHQALEEVRRLRLFRETHPSWEAFCQDVLGYSEARASQLIAAARDLKDLQGKIDASLLPTTEGALRKLRSVDEDKKVEVLTLAAELSSLNRPTAASITEAMERLHLCGQTKPHKEQRLKPKSVLKATKETCYLIKNVKREEFTIGEHADMMALLAELQEAAAHLESKTV